jgi:hypothetical protein
MKKTLLTLCLSLGMAALTTSALAQESQQNPISGRIQYSNLPGEGAGSMKSLDQKLPQPSIRVGPSGDAGVGLAFLIGIEVTPAGRNALMMAEKVELLIDVVGVDQFNGAPPSPLRVALLHSGASANPQFYGHFGAWNDAKHFAEVGFIESDPAAGVYKFDVTKAMSNAPATTSNKPMIFFAIYSPLKDLVAANAGQHVLISGSGETAPRLQIIE